jgi:hypothetical protein
MDEATQIALDNLSLAIGSVFALRDDLEIIVNLTSKTAEVRIRNAAEEVFGDYIADIAGDLPVGQTDWSSIICDGVLDAREEFRVA